jgi:cytochrome c oxidase subunit 2
VAALAFSAQALAYGPVDGEIGLVPSATDVHKDITFFHNAILMPIITVITLFVLALLLWVIVRYNAKANPVPKTFTHNTTVEIVWTVIPVFILIFISLYSFPLLAKEERIPKADITIKATGNTWFWTHEYPEYGGLAVTSNPLSKEDSAAQNRPYLLAVDNPIYVPVGKTVEVLVTSNDVIHAWTIPNFGIKEDAIPGRVNQGWFKAEKEGIFYGQCSELCGIKHAYMPIEIHVVPEAQFNEWVLAQGGTLPAAPGTAVPVDTPPADLTTAPPAEPAATPAEAAPAAPAAPAAAPETPAAPPR